jgi:hypothetical protein
LDKKALLATGVISAKLATIGRADFALSVRGVKLFAASTGEAAAWAGGEDGALTVAASSGTVLVVLETEAWRGRAAGRLERNP